MFGKQLHEPVRIDLPGSFVSFHLWEAAPVARYGLMPGGKVRGAGDGGVQELEEDLGVGMPLNVGLDLGPELVPVYVYVNFLSAAGEGVRAGAGLPGVQPRTQHQQQVAIGESHVAVAGTVRAYHAGEDGIALVYRVQPHQRTDHWD